MHISYPFFDELLDKYLQDVYRLCFLLIPKPAVAWQAAFQTFLYMGTQPEACPTPEEEQKVLFQWCVKTCEDLYYRKMQKCPKRDSLAKSVPFPVSDCLWELLGQPFKKRKELFFCAYLNTGLESEAQAADGHSRITNPSTIRDALATISMRPEELASFHDQIYLRFEERNVPLENKLRILRSHWDHAVIWLAVAVILLFAAAAWYTAGLSG